MNAVKFVQIETSCVSIHEYLKQVINFQTHFRLREAQGRVFADSINGRVQVGAAIALSSQLDVLQLRTRLSRGFRQSLYTVTLHWLPNRIGGESNASTDTCKIGKRQGASFSCY